MPRFCNKTFKRRKFGANYKDSSASEDLNKGQPASMYIKNSSSKSKLGKFNDEYVSFLDSSENFCEIIDILLFSSVLKQHVLCVKCKKQGIDIKFGRQIQGLVTELLICCEFCGLIQPLLNTRFTNTVVNKKDTKMWVKLSNRAPFRQILKNRQFGAFLRVVFRSCNPTTTRNAGAQNSRWRKENH
ncbi:hypothetical protein TNCV_2031381 [Trichonephila clavipes]|nr:hypothetical protein TNCV_2031381 [Trichonephila clavipes]